MTELLPWLARLFISKRSGARRSGLDATVGIPAAI